MMELNVTDTTLPSPINPFDQLLDQIIVPIVFCLITLVGVIGNSLVICVILTRNKMRSATNLLLLNLAIADVTFVIICPPFTAYQQAILHWPFGDITCKLMHYLVNVSAYVTIYTLVLIAIIRYLTIVHNQRTVRIRSVSNVTLMMICIWVLMLVVNTPIIWSYSAYPIDINDKNSDIECGIVSWEEGKRSFATFFVFSYVLPLIVIIIFSACILHFICTQRTSTLNVESRTRGDKRKRQACRILIIVIILFAVLWLPVHIYLLLIYFYDFHPQTNLDKALLVLFKSLAYSNSCVNPVVYNYVSKEFRDSFGDVVMCRLRRQGDNQGACPSTKTTTAQYSPETRQRRKTRLDSELIPLANGHAVVSEIDDKEGVSAQVNV